jgi:hypothetical protein
MACKQETKVVGDKTIFCRQLPATKAMVIKAKLIQIGGENILPFVEGKADILAMMRLEQMAKPEELVALIKELVCQVRVNGEEVMPQQFDMKYQGNLWEVVELFAFACEVNYKDFFEQGFSVLNQSLYPQEQEVESQEEK